ncbi:hypothetical protein RG565_00435 [Streptococcus sp. IsoGale021]|uniref:hypothetical protein n=1 Tax=Streptococcus TaxID=1301 RepID=UPI00200194C5|nr:MULTISPECIES: hypothetical protein [Streptococcus]MCY7209751.1 hypothetical protein [Streptococcus anginosus]MCY7211496.1 hypothetical protein [Streptococcus anginosus]MCY7226623.1 hypothetical protein [Streptococcus anginosus]MDQ8693817.1 hypothetical protein [Streptococcus sp. IsoGale021]MDU5128939.1 hypothetical protein [Streptococcus anginosus]
MKNILDKLDQSSLWLRISIVTALALILAAGLFFVKKQDDATRAAAPTVRRTISTSKSSESKAEKEKKEQAKIAQEAEEAVKKLEAEQTTANVTPAQEKVDKLKDEAQKAQLQQRIKAVSDAIAAREANEAAATANQNAVTPQTDAGQTYQQTYPQTYQAPATSATTGQAETNSTQTPTTNGNGASVPTINTTGQ